MGVEGMDKTHFLNSAGAAGAAAAAGFPLLT
jgi:hypothetical protein